MATKGGPFVSPSFAVEGGGQVVSALKARSLKGKKRVELACGYTAPYAVFVHGDMEAFHPVGNAKFLEGPMRRGRGQMGKIVVEVLRSKHSLEDAVLAAAEWLKDASQAEVPVDTGWLRDGWFMSADGTVPAPTPRPKGYKGGD